MEAWVEITRPDGTMERHRIEGEQVTVGRSPTAGIPLVNADDLEPEHLLVAPRPDGCWVSVAEGASPATSRGRAVRAEVVPWGTELTVGSVELRVTDRPTPTRRASTGGVSWPVIIAAFIGLPLAGWLLLSDPVTEVPLEAGVPPPELFAAEASCDQGGSSALHLAREAAEAASHRSERYPFDAQDGVAAVKLWGEAGACYDAAGRADDARRVERERRAMAQRLEEDYRTHRLRLERALEKERWDDALRESRALLSLTDHLQGDAYVTWLTLLERRLQLIVDSRVGGES